VQASAAQECDDRWHSDARLQKGCTSVSLSRYLGAAFRSYWSVPFHCPESAVVLSFRRHLGKETGEVFYHCNFLGHPGWGIHHVVFIHRGMEWFSAIYSAW